MKFLRCLCTERRIRYPIFTGEKILKGNRVLRRIAMKRICFHFFYVFLIFNIASCSLLSPGPISVTTEVSPETVTSGSNITITARVTNNGGKVKIERVHLKEEFISGWAAVESAEADVPARVYEIGPNDSGVVFELSSPVYNTGTTDVMVRETVTVYSDGGIDSDSATFTLITAYSAYSASISKTLRGLFQTEIK